MLKKKFNAFTLAEVLITLGIIGVVAALTMPSLIANYQKKAYVTQLKKTTNTILNGYKLMLADNDVDSLQNTDFYKYFQRGPHNETENISNILKKYFNVVDINLIFNSNDSIQYSPAISSAYPYPFKMEYCLLVKLADGAAICFSNYNAALIDVNGHNKLPNKVGLDFFKINLNDNAQIDKTYCGDDWIGTSHPYGPQNSFCKVLEDNWEITYY